MTAYEILQKAILRLGYQDYKIDKVTAQGLEAVNQICVDLKIKPVKTLSDYVTENNSEAEAICCGVAMLLSLAEADREKNEIFTSIYNSKRAGVLSKVEYIEDILPKVGEGE